MQQKRLILAFALSTAILVLWSYFVPNKPPQNSNQPPVASASPPITVSKTEPSNSSQIQASTVTPTLNAAPQRILDIKTPLYEAKFDSRGAEPISWIIKKNKKSGNDTYSVAGNKRDRVPLELISPEGLK